ncbi:MAG: hypothetical protein AB7P08_14110 [Burkholderiales bacterium]
MKPFPVHGVALAIGALAMAGWLAPLASGYFLSDDFVIFAMFGDAEEKRTLLASAFAKFAAGLDVATSRFYRPLPHLSFAACYALFGADASPWLLVNLAAHLATALLVAVLAWQLHGDRSWRSVAGGLAGATVFVAFAPGLEAAAWVAARYDAFATFFSLASCAAFVAARRRWGAAAGISLAAFALAILSKESAAMVPPAIVVLAIWKRRDEPLSPVSRLSAAFADAWPWIALAVAYLLLRAAIFGTPFEVYAGSRPGAFALSPERWASLAGSIAPWARAQFPEVGNRLALAVLVAAMLATALALFDRRAVAGTVAALVLAAGSLLILSPHLGGLQADGSGGRLFHMTGAFLGVLVGVAGGSARMRGIASVLAVFVASATLLAGTAARERWVRAHGEMRAVAGGLGRLYATLDAKDHALVVIPEARGPIPFGLNGQAGLMLPPVQARSISDRILVQTAGELAGTAQKFRRGIIANLRRFPLLQLDAKGIDGPAEYPTQIYCWPESGTALVAVPVPAAGDAQAWLESVRAGLEARACATK